MSHAELDVPHRLLLSRFRSVAFAALGAGVTEEDLREALEVAVVADARRVSAEPSTTEPRRLQVVPDPD